MNRKAPLSIAWLSILSAVGILAFVAPATAATLNAVSSDFHTLRLTPDQLTVTPGEQFTIDLTLTGLNDGDVPILGAFDLDIFYFGDNIAFENYSLGDGLGDLTLGESTDLSTGPDQGTHINFAHVSNLSASELGGLQQETFTLVSLEFSAIGPGAFDALILISAIPQFFDAQGESFLVNVINEGARVTVVPLPAAIWLFVGALALIPAKRRSWSRR